MTTFKTITEAREDAGYTMRELATAAGISSGTVSAWESARCAPATGSAAVVACASVLGCQPTELLFRSPGAYSQFKTVAPKGAFTVTQG